MPLLVQTAVLNSVSCDKPGTSDAMDADINKCEVLHRERKRLFAICTRFKEFFMRL